MINWSLGRRYQAAGFGLGGVLLKQSLYPRSTLVDALEGSDLVLDLGCGEGLLTNLLATALPRTRFVGVDLDAGKITAARQCAAGSNVSFHPQDLFTLAESGASAVLFNDVLHHLSPEHQDRALDFARQRLDGAGVLVLKEVAATDTLDRLHTTFWDRRFYPRDQLHFRTLADWTSLARRHGFRLLRQASVRHPWIASRSLLVFGQRPRMPLPRPPVPAVTTLPPLRILVTGGTGFIGGWLLRTLLDEPIEGRSPHLGVVTRRPWSVPPELANDPRVEVINVDLAQPVAPGALGRSWDYVFHLAAEVDYFGGEATYRNNLAATTHLLDALKSHPPRRIVFASTMGALDRARLDPGVEPLTENHPAHPTSPYGRAKVAEEELVRNCGLPAVILRIPWCYGPGMARSHHVRRLLGDVRRGALATRFRWPGRVSLISAPSAARAFIRAAQLPQAAGQTYFISDGQPLSFGELFAEMGHVTGNPNAGMATIPAPGRWLLRRFHFLLPFPLKALVCDALVVSDARARALGISGEARPEWFLDSLARFDAGEDYTSRWRGCALVTGAASGIGRALARQLHARGHGLRLIDRDAAALADLVARIETNHAVFDLATLDADLAASQLAGADLPRVSLVVNNAGVGFRSGYAELPPSALDVTLAVNVRAVVLATAAFTREMSARGGGVIVNVASTAAFQPLPYMAAYAASKSFVLSFSLAAATEIRPGPKVDVLAVSPSGTATNFQKSGSVKVNPNETLSSPEAAAVGILRAISRRRLVSVIGVRGHAMGIFSRLAPTFVLVRTWERLMRKGR